MQCWGVGLESVREGRPARLMESTDSIDSLEWFVNLFGKQVLGRRHCGPNPMKSFWDRNLFTLQWSPSPFVFSKLAPGAERAQSDILRYAIV
jgi:hypothetical protein